MAELTAAFEAYLSPHNANPNLLAAAYYVPTYAIEGDDSDDDDSEANGASVIANKALDAWFPDVSFVGTRGDVDALLSLLI